MTEQKHGNVAANGIQVHYVEQGQGPLVVFCHGFPESWYSWRHQLSALAAAGYRAVALDMRGYGGTSKPQDISAYTVSHMVGDVVGTIAALGEKQAVVVGHDWGAPIAWYSALMRPDVIRAAAVLSVPYNPPPPLPPELKLTDLMRQAAGDREYYRLYFQEPGVAEQDFEKDVRDSVLRMLYGVSGDFLKKLPAAAVPDGHYPKGSTFRESMPLPKELPAWLTEADVAFYTKELTASGFRGGLNWYRNMDALPGLLSPFIGKPLLQPTLYLYGELDLVAGNRPDAIEAMQKSLPNLKKVVKYKDAGHWLQQERPEEVNNELIAFLKSL
jgi:pimeloyl-ACP methyl ester carboxylesterase